MKRIIIYIAFLFPCLCLLAACTDKEDIGTSGSQPQSYIPFQMKRGVNISHWLSQSDVRGEQRKAFFTEAEVQQLAGFGFDHLRLPLDEEQLFTEDGQKIPEAFELVHNAIKWCKNANMRIIVDMHILRAHTFNNTPSEVTYNSIYDDFEDGGNPWWPSDGGATVQVENVVNPDKNGINTSNRALRINKTNSGQDWQAGGRNGFIIPLGPNENQFKYLRFKVYKNKKSPITIVLGDEAGQDHYTGYENQTVNQWEDIIVDLQSVMNGMCKQLILRPDNVEGEMLIDDVFFTDSPTGNNTEITVVSEATVPKLWTDKEAQYKYLNLWGQLADELKDYPNDLVAYELLNEPVAPYSSQWNSLASQLVRELRLKEPERKLIIGSNKWQGVDTFKELAVPANDPNIILSFHFYNPHLFTHYQADWTEMKDLNTTIHYPGEIITKEDYAKLSEKDKKIVDPFMGTYNKAVLASMVEKAMDQAKKLGLQLHCGEFGCYTQTPRADKVNWLQDIISILRDNNIAYSYWDYKGGFGFCNSKGEVIDQELINLLTK